MFQGDSGHKNDEAESSSYFNLQDDSFDTTSTEEVSLISEGIRPSTTSELVEMLKHAGTEITVKYLTGEISFEDFCLELDKMKPEEPKTASTATAVVSPLLPSSSHVPAFHKIFGNDGAEEEEEDIEDDDEEEEEEDEEVEDTADSELVDAGELSDLRDEEWTPGEKATKKGKGKKAKLKQTEEHKISARMGKPKRRYRKRRRKYDLPKQLAGANGKALLLRAQGKTEEAMLLLYDIMSKAPKAADPYYALGMIHEDQGNVQQALKFFMVAANLRGSHATEWLELVEMCVRLSEDKLALDCFSKALKTAKNNQAKLEILTKKSEYFEQMQMPIKAMQCREQMLTFMDRKNPASILSYARSIANDYMEFKEENGAISVLQYMHKEFPNDIDSEDVHNLAELLMAQKSFIKSLEIIIKHCGVKMDFGDHPTSSDDLANMLEVFEKKEVTLKSLTFPPLMPVDLRSKLVQCIVRIKVLETLEVIADLIKSLADTDVETYGDIHYDIAETMVECCYHEEARMILQALVHSEKYNKAAVWLTFGQCLNALGDLRAATEAYTQVVEMVPGHYGARVTLSSLLQQMGHNEFALAVLSGGQCEEGEASADEKLLLHKCQLLHSQGKIDEFITETQKLLSFNFRGQCSPEFIRVLLGIRTPKCRRSFFPHFSASKKSDQEKEAAVEAPEVKKGEEKKFRSDLWDVYVKLCCAMHEKRLSSELLETSLLGLTCPAFSQDDAMVKEAEFLCLKIGPVNISIYHLARNLIVEEKDKNQAWNLYNYIFSRLKEVTDLRFAMRALMKNPNSLALGMLNGNARMISGTYKQALGEYLTVFRRSPDNDMALLCSALCLVHIASQTYSNKKNLLIIQAVCLLSAYKELRGECQETYYNLGRAMNQLEIHHAAVHYYKKALEFPPVVIDDQGTFDLSREIAYSLAQIYQKSNSLEHARYYIEKYCVI